MCVIIGHYIFAVWCTLYFALWRKHESIRNGKVLKCGKICTKRHKMILIVVLNVTVIFYFIHRHVIETHQNTGKDDVNEKARSDVTQ